MATDMDKRIEKFVADEKSKELARLRDEFAMAATSEDLKPFIKKFFVKGTKFDGALTRIVDVECETPTYEARYAFADAMLKARESK